MTLTHSVKAKMLITLVVPFLSTQLKLQCFDAYSVIQCHYHIVSETAGTFSEPYSRHLFQGETPGVLKTFHLRR